MASILENSAFSAELGPALLPVEFENEGQRVHDITTFVNALSLMNVGKLKCELFSYILDEALSLPRLRRNKRFLQASLVKINECIDEESAIRVRNQLERTRNLITGLLFLYSAEKVELDKSL